jgi:DNA-binding XRE family transcriptional regulator
MTIERKGKEIGARIKQFRIAQAPTMTRSDFAALIGLSLDDLCDLEAGKKLLPPHVAQKIQEAFPIVTWQWLYDVARECEA